jgi:hypothetical protein
MCGDANDERDRRCDISSFRTFARTPSLQCSVGGPCRSDFADALRGPHISFDETLSVAVQVVLKRSFQQHDQRQAFFRAQRVRRRTEVMHRRLLKTDDVLAVPGFSQDGVDGLLKRLLSADLHRDSDTGEMPFACASRTAVFVLCERCHTLKALSFRRRLTREQQYVFGAMQPERDSTHRSPTRVCRRRPWLRSRTVF